MRPCSNSLRLAALCLIAVSAIVISADKATAQAYELVVAPQSFEFTLAEGDTLDDSIFITEAEGQSVDIEVVNSSDWLSLPFFLTCPKTPTTIPFAVSSSGLSPGLYHDTITVTIYIDCQTYHSHVDIPVEMTVADGMEATLASLPTSMEFFLSQGDTLVGESLYIFDVEGSSYNFWTYNSSSWLYVDTMEASPLYTPELISVDIYTGMLAPGVYSDTILVFADEAWNSPLRIPVDLHVAGGENILATDPAFFEFSLNHGDSIFGESLYVYETYGRSINFWAYNQSAWLEIDTAQAIPLYAPELLFLNLRTADLTPGFYADTVFVISSAAANSPLALPVYLTVSDSAYEYYVEAIPTEFDFYLSPGDIKYDSIYVYEVLGRNVPFTCSYSSIWLTVQPDSAFPGITPGILDIIVTDSGMQPGEIYTDTIFIEPASDSMPFPSVAVPVTATLITSEIDLLTIPEYFQFSLDSGGILMDRLLYVYDASGGSVDFLADAAIGSGWLEIMPNDSPGPGFLTPDSVFFNICTDSLSPGFYVDSIILYDPFGMDLFDPVAVPVGLTVTENICGDVDGNGLINILDVTSMIVYLYKGASPARNIGACDVDGSGVINLLDVVYLIDFLYRGGPEPDCP